MFTNYIFSKTNFKFPFLFLLDPRSSWRFLEFFWRSNFEIQFYASLNCGTTLPIFNQYVNFHLSTKEVLCV